MCLGTFSVTLSCLTPGRLPHKKDGKARRTLGVKKNPILARPQRGRSVYWAESKMTGDNALFWNRHLGVGLLFKYFRWAPPIFYMGVPPGSYLDFSDSDYPDGCTSRKSGWCRVCGIFLNPILYFRGRGDCFAALFQTDSKIDAIEMNNSNGKCSNHTHSDKKKMTNSKLFSNHAGLKT